MGMFRVTIWVIGVINRRGSEFVTRRSHVGFEGCPENLKRFSCFLSITLKTT